MKTLEGVDDTYSLARKRDVWIDRLASRQKLNTKTSNSLTTLMGPLQ